MQITRFEGPDPEPAEGREVFEISTAGVNFADTHHRLS